MPHFLIEKFPFRAGIVLFGNIGRWNARKPYAKQVFHDVGGRMATHFALEDPRQNSGYGVGGRVVEWGAFVDAGIPAAYVSTSFQTLVSDRLGRPTLVFHELPAANCSVDAYVWNEEAQRYDACKLIGEATIIDESQLWIGPVIKGGATAVIAGKEIAVGALGNIKTGQVFPFLMTGTRAGLGWGASGGVALGIGYGTNTPQGFVGTDTSNLVDFSLALGEQWGTFLKTANPKALRSSLALVQAGSVWLKQIQGTVRSTEKLVKATSAFVNSEAGVNLAKSFAGLSVLDTGGPNFTSIDVPGIGTGAELAVFTTFASIKAVDQKSVEAYLASVKSNPFGAS